MDQSLPGSPRLKKRFFQISFAPYSFYSDIKKKKEKGKKEI